ncbi:class I SAM-dependent methyltransferase [Rapidithrix thailandica]|uniref:Class I SAM-dependent methyltransferase n=1 Tax=Rapidithrix thailandica TaxID=413964 RepID=A0AAW9S834_9BACT
MKYKLQAQDAHGVHSPFVFALYTQAIACKKQYYHFERIGRIRKKLLKSREQIDVTDFGAGSKKMNSNQRKVAEIAKYSVSSTKVSELLFRLVDYFNPKSILELGTCLGVNTLYMNLASHKAEVITFEGCNEIAKVAQGNFRQFKNKPIKIVTGNLDDTLAPKVKEVPKLDFVFFDANHRKEPTLNYFRTCLSKAHEASVFIFDDIHWSDEMEEAWQEIQNHPDVTLTVDLFQVGLVFFRKKQPKQHFTLKF